jgi:hypothetical protein
MEPHHCNERVWYLLCRDASHDSPTGQGAHEGWPDCACTWPIVQGRQMPSAGLLPEPVRRLTNLAAPVALDLLLGTSPYLPAGQLLQYLFSLAAPARRRPQVTAYFPRLQDMKHAVEPARLDWSSGHGAHSVIPESGCRVPTEQTTHALLEGP